MEPKPYRPRCIHLTCRSMQVWGDDFENDPEYQAGMVEFTCTQTFKTLGPDNSDVSLPLCSNHERVCFREFIDLSTGPKPIEPNPFSREAPASADATPSTGAGPLPRSPKARG